MVRFLWIGVLLYGGLSTLNISAQTCCSGGVPVASNLGMPNADHGSLQLSLSYDFNRLNTLKAGTEVLDDRNRNRTTHSGLLEIGYSFSRRLSFDALFSYVRQERNVNNFGVDQFTATQGIGDATFLAKYLVLDQQPWQLSAGVGVKAPFGASDLPNEQGITLNADLQPGSGAWDLVGWISTSTSLGNRSSRSLFATTIYARKGHNTDYLGSQDYKFGNEWQVIAGLSDRFLVLNQIFDLTVSLRFRDAAEDEINSQNVPSTGGAWVFFNPGVSWWPSPTFSWQANVEIPLHANITGTQVTPTIRFNTGVYYIFGNSKNNLDL